MQTFTEADWTRVLKHKEIVFARTMPQQKQDIGQRGATSWATL